MERSDEQLIMEKVMALCRRVSPGAPVPPDLHDSLRSLLDKERTRREE
jgi:hypothetical protein